MSKLLGYILVALVAIGGTWYYLQGNVNTDNPLYKKKLDSLSTEKEVQSRIIDSLKKDTAKQGERIEELKSIVGYERCLRDSLEQAAKKETNEIDSLPLDSVATIIKDYFGGGDYKIIKLDSGIYVAFSGNLTREIGKGTLELKKLKKLEMSYRREVNTQDSIISVLSLKSMKQDSMMDALRNKLNLEESKGELRKQRIENLKEKVGIYKIVGISGVVFGIVISVL